MLILKCSSSSQKLLKNSGHLSYPHLLALQDKQAPYEILDYGHLPGIAIQPKGKRLKGGFWPEAVVVQCVSKWEKDTDGQDTRIQVFICNEVELRSFSDIIEWV